MKKKILFIIAACLQLSTSYAQSNYELKQTTIRSTILGQDRLLKIHLPIDYDEEVLYPVIYITDAGGPNFNVAKNYMEVLVDPAYDLIPKCILVGIVQQNRNKELNVRGSGKLFMAYLFEEVIPLIDSNYSTSGFNVMIGHSDGAEYNHLMMLTEENPFRGFISLSTNFNLDVETELSNFFKEYTSNNIYYFIANASLDHPNRINAGNEFEVLASENANDKIKFIKKTYQADHTTVVPFSLMDGLRHIFQDYGKNSAKAYPSIYEYAENFLSDLKANYGMEGSYDIYTIVPYLNNITRDKDLEAFEYFIKFVDEHKLWFNPTTGEPAGMDPLNIANAYYDMEMMPEVITYWRKALENFDTVDPAAFSGNLFKVLRAYKGENRSADAVLFLEKSIEKLPQEYVLGTTYKLAKFSLLNKVSTKKGKKALKYCRDNFVENRFFTLNDLEELEKM